MSTCVACCQGLLLQTGFTKVEPEREGTAEERKARESYVDQEHENINAVCLMRLLSA